MSKHDVIAAIAWGPKRRRRTKSFSEPPFWSLARLGNSLLGSSLPDKEKIENNFDGYIQGVYKADGVVFACILARQLVFSEARFQWRRLRNGRPGDLFGTPELGLLETPWPNGTTGDLLMRMEAESSLAGNFYATLADDAGRLGRAATGDGRRVAKMRPDRVTIVVGSRSGDPYALDARPVGYLYEPPVTGAGTARSAPVVLMPDEVCHYAPIPDPAAQFRGMSWLTPVLREVASDRAATSHKLKFFENGASLATVVRFDRETTPAAFDAFVERFKEHHRGTDNAYETLFLGGGADVTVVGADMRQLDFKAIQGGGETRIAMAARVHPVILGSAEGLGASGLNAAIAQPARRMFVDGTMRPLWRMAAGALSTLVTSPDGAVLWYDDRDIAFLREDRSDVAQIQQNQAQTMRQLFDGGWEPDSIRDAVLAEDWSLLVHSGVPSVQVQPTTAATSEPSTNGNGERTRVEV